MGFLSYEQHMIFLHRHHIYELAWQVLVAHLTTQIRAEDFRLLIHVSRRWDHCSRHAQDESVAEDKGVIIAITLIGSHSGTTSGDFFIEWCQSYHGSLAHRRAR
jgi:hypothetical protein